MLPFGRGRIPMHLTVKLCLISPLWRRSYVIHRASLVDRQYSQAVQNSVPRRIFVVEGVQLHT
jgi:hypothetical protein